MHAYAPEAIAVQATKNIKKNAFEACERRMRDVWKKGR